MLKDFILFRKMLTPALIQILFWIAVIACIAGGMTHLIRKQWSVGLQILIVGPLLVRVIAEWFILFFRMNETLTQIRANQHK